MKFLIHFFKYFTKYFSKPTKTKAMNSSSALLGQIYYLIHQLHGLSHHIPNLPDQQRIDNLIQEFQYILGRLERGECIFEEYRKPKGMELEMLTSLLDNLIELINSIGSKRLGTSKYSSLISTIGRIRSLLTTCYTHELSYWFQQARERTKVIWHYIGFFATLVALVIFMGFPFLQDEESCETTCDSDKWYETLTESVASKLTFLAAFSGALLFLGYQISNKRRLQEEYRHKETMLKTFTGFSFYLSNQRRAIEININTPRNNNTTENEDQPTENNDVNTENNDQRIKNIDKASYRLTLDAIRVIGENPAESIQQYGGIRKLIRKMGRTVEKRIESSINDVLNE